MPIGLGSALWAVVLPVEEVNLCTNPSYEFNSVGAVAIQSATLGTTSQFQRYGAWSLRVTPNSNGTSGAVLGTWTSGNGTTYSVSAYAFVESGVPMRLAVGDGNGLNLIGSVAFTGGGTWQWYDVPAFTEAGAGQRSVVLQKTSGNSQLAYYADGVKISPWTDGLGRTTTYFDGDTGGGTWAGAQQASQSFRPSQYRGGGSIIALADLGLSVDQFPGAGVPPIDVSTQSYAVTAGAEFQRQRASQRSFTLTAKPINGTSLGDFHAVRRALWDALKPDAVTPPQSVTLLYYGAQGTQGISAYYDKGLELGRMDGPIAEDAAISFLATDPYWYAPTQQGTMLIPRSALGSTNFLAWRDPRGKWGTLGANGTTVWAPASGTAAVYAVANINGTVIFGGFFGSVAGIGVQGIGYYANGALGSLAGGGVGAGQQVTALAVDAGGSLYAGGNFIAAGGTSTNYVARWANVWGTLIGGTMTHTANQGVQALAINQTGTLFLGGTFNGAAGSVSRNLVQWFNNAYGTLKGQQSGTIDGIVQALTIGLNNRLFFGGEFGSAGGTAADNVGQWFGSFGTMAAGVDQKVAGLATMLDGRIAITGNLLNAGGGSAKRAAFWNGVQYTPLGGGITSGVPVTAFVRNDNSLLISGYISQVGSVPTPAGAVVWNGYTFLPFDIDLNIPGAGAGIWDFTQTPDGTVWAGGDFLGTAQAASVAAIVNGGRAAVYPSLRLRNRSAGTARVYQTVNATTGDGIYFNLALLAGEQADLVLQPGKRSFTSTFRGNILSSVLPGSNLATFNLLPGTNYISFFSDNDSLEASFFWTPKGWSIDSGTVF
jgi:hypothetical protein